MKIGDTDWCIHARFLPCKYKLLNGVVIWEPALIHSDADIGKDCMIGAFTNICGPVKIGDRTRIQGFCYIPSGVEIGRGVFIGPNVTFANVKWPAVRLKRDDPPEYLKIFINNWASIGAGVTILPGVTIGNGALIGAGSVVTKDVESGWVVYGNPARHIRRLP